MNRSHSFLHTLQIGATLCGLVAWTACTNASAEDGGLSVHNDSNEAHNSSPKRKRGEATKSREASPVLEKFSGNQSAGDPKAREREERDRLNTLLLQHSMPYLGSPYKSSPLGEGASGKFDQDPLFREDAFDCTTFVETVLAKVRAEYKGKDWKEELNRLRYRKGEIGYVHRRHFPYAQWILDFQSEGILKEYSFQIGSENVRLAVKDLTPGLWKKRKKKILKNLPEKFVPFGKISIPYLPIRWAYEHREEFPEASILNLVRIDRENIPVQISHQALILRKEGRLIVRHAQQRFVHKVFDESLENYLRRVQNHREWPVLGVNIQALQFSAKGL